MAVVKHIISSKIGSSKLQFKIFLKYRLDLPKKLTIILEYPPLDSLLYGFSVYCNAKWINL